MTILCAVDGDETPDQSVAIAHDLATAYGEELVVLHVLPRERFDDRADDRPTYYIDDGAADAAETARAVVEATLEDPGDYTPNGRVGQPTEEILEEVDRVNARFLVLSGRKRTPVGKAIFGSTTQSVLLNADCPVVTTMHPSE